MGSSPEHEAEELTLAPAAIEPVDELVQITLEVLSAQIGKRNCVFGNVR